MSDVLPIPEGYHTITPHLVVDGAVEAIEFYRKAFGAEEVCSMPAPDGRLMHAELKIGDSPLFLCDDFPDFDQGKQRAPRSLGATTTTLHISTEDCDGAIERAVDAGATLTMPPMDMFWGDRYGKVTDPWGHEWSFSTHIADLSPEEIQKAGEAMFSDPDACKGEG